MGLFGDLDVASAADNPFEIPANTYECTLTDVSVGPTKAGDKVGMTLKYTIQGDGDYADMDITEWKEIPQPADPQNLTAEEKRANSWLKQRLLSLGVPETRVNSVEVDDLLGTDLTVTIAEGKKGYMNVTKVEVR
jgi:hypothetical protein